MRAKALGMEVAFYDPYRSDGYDKALGIERVETLDELLSRAFAVSCHCPLTSETHHIIDAAAIDKMPDRSYLINTSRGGVVDVAAIPEAIARGKLAGAGIDVLPQEPPSDSHPLIVAWRNPDHPAHCRVILNAHNAFYSEEGLRDMRLKGAEACRRMLLGRPMRNIVNGV
jgi:D-3-phosphoglycerate dehydrogenase/C-terminal binding protein